jgi:hypothetical protein
MAAKEPKIHILLFVFMDKPQDGAWADSTTFTCHLLLTFLSFILANKLLEKFYDLQCHFDAYKWPLPRAHRRDA